MVELEVGEGAAVSGKELKDIELPNDALITAVIRNEKLHTPRGETNIFSGDTLYILVSKKNREKIKAIFQGDGHEAAESSE
jgi:cell volume regulation protein A